MARNGSDYDWLRRHITKGFRQGFSIARAVAILVGAIAFIFLFFIPAALVSLLFPKVGDWVNTLLFFPAAVSSIVTFHLVWRRLDPSVDDESKE
jgi:amino acid transporter